MNDLNQLSYDEVIEAVGLLSLVMQPQRGLLDGLYASDDCF